MGVLSSDGKDSRSSEVAEHARFVSSEGPSPLCDGIDVGGELRRCLASFRRLKQLLLSPETPPEVLGKLLEQPSLQQRLCALRSSFLSSVDRALPPSVAPSYRSSLRTLRQKWRRQLRVEAGLQPDEGSHAEIAGGSEENSKLVGGGSSTAPCCSCCSVPSEAVLFELVSAYLLTRLNGSQQLLLPAFHPSLLRETIDISQPGVLRELGDLLLDEQLCMFWCVTFICDKAAEAVFEKDSSDTREESPTLRSVCLSFARRLVEENEAEAELLRSYSHLNAPCDPSTCFFLERESLSHMSQCGNPDAGMVSAARREARELHDLTHLQQTLQLQCAAAFSLAAVHKASKAIRVLKEKEKNAAAPGKDLSLHADLNADLLGCSSDKVYRFCERVYDDHFCGALAACSGEKRALLRSRSLLREGLQLAGASASLVLAAYPLEAVKTLWLFEKGQHGEGASQANALCGFVESSNFVSLHRDVMHCCMQSIRQKLEREQEHQQYFRQGTPATVQPLTDAYEDMLYSCYIEQPSAASLMLAAHGVVLSAYRRLRLCNVIPKSGVASTAALTAEEIDSFLSQCSEFVFPLLIYALQLLLRQHDLLQRLPNCDPLGQSFASQLFCLLDCSLLTFPFEQLQCLDGAVQVASELLALLPSQRQLLAVEFCGSNFLCAEASVPRSGVLRLVSAFVSLAPYGSHALFQILAALLPPSAVSAASLQSAVDGEGAECDLTDTSKALRFLMHLSSPLKRVLLPPIEGAVKVSNGNSAGLAGAQFVTCTALPIEMCVLTMMNFHHSLQQPQDSQQPKPVFDASAVNGGVTRWSVLMPGSESVFEEVHLWRFLSGAASAFADLSQWRRREANKEVQLEAPQVFWLTEAEGRRFRAERIQVPLEAKSGNIRQGSSSSFLVGTLRWDLDGSAGAGSNQPSKRDSLSLLSLMWLIFDAGLKHQEQQCGPMNPAAFRTFVSACGFWMKVAALPSAARVAVEALIADRVYGQSVASAGSSVAAAFVAPSSSAMDEAPFLLLPRIYALVCLAASNPQLHLLLPEGLHALRLCLGPAYLSDVNRCLAFLARPGKRCFVEIPPPQQQDPVVAPEMIHFGWRFLQFLVADTRNSQNPLFLNLPVLLQRISSVTETLELHLRVFPVVLATLRFLLQLLKTVPASVWGLPFQFQGALAAAAAMEGLPSSRSGSAVQDSVGGGSSGTVEEPGLTEALFFPAMQAVLCRASLMTEVQIEATASFQIAAFSGLCSYVFTGVWGRLEGWSFLQPAERCAVAEVLLRLLLQLLSLVHPNAETFLTSTMEAEKAGPPRESKDPRSASSVFLQSADSLCSWRPEQSAVVRSVQTRQRELLSAFLEALAAGDVPSGLVGVLHCLLLCFPAPGESPGVPWGELESSRLATTLSNGSSSSRPSVPSARLSFASAVLRVFGCLDASTFSRTSSVTAASASLLATAPLSSNPGDALVANAKCSVDREAVEEEVAGQMLVDGWNGSIFLKRRDCQGRTAEGTDLEEGEFVSVQIPETLLPDVVSLEPFCAASRWSSGCWLHSLERIEVCGAASEVASAVACSVSPVSSVYGAAGLVGAATATPCGELSQRVVLNALLCMHHLMLATTGPAGKDALAGLASEVARLTTCARPPSPVSAALLPSSADGVPGHAGDLLASQQRREFETLLALNGLLSTKSAPPSRLLQSSGEKNGEDATNGEGEPRLRQTVVCRASFAQSLLALADSRAKVTASALLSLLCVFWRQQQLNSNSSSAAVDGNGFSSSTASLAAALSYEPPELEEALGGSVQTLERMGIAGGRNGRSDLSYATQVECRRLVKELYTDAFASRLLRHLYLNESRYVEFRLALLQLLLLAADAQEELLLVGESRAFEGAVSFSQQAMYDVLEGHAKRRGKSPKEGTQDGEANAVVLGELKALRLSLLLLERLLSRKDASARRATLSQLLRQTKTGLSPLSVGDASRCMDSCSAISSARAEPVTVSGGWKLLFDVASFVVGQWKLIRWKRGVAWLKQSELCVVNDAPTGDFLKSSESSPSPCVARRSSFVGGGVGAFGSQSRLLSSVGVDLPLYTNAQQVGASATSASSEAEEVDEEEGATPLLIAVELCGCLQSLINCVRAQLQLLRPHSSGILNGGASNIRSAENDDNSSSDLFHFLRLAYFLTSSPDFFAILFPSPSQPRPAEDFENPGLVPLQSSLYASRQLQRVTKAKGIGVFPRWSAFDSLWRFPAFLEESSDQRLLGSLRVPPSQQEGTWRSLTDPSISSFVSVIRASTVKASSAQHGLGFGVDSRALLILAVEATLRELMETKKELSRTSERGDGASLGSETTASLLSLKNRARSCYAFPWELASLAPRAAVSLALSESQGLLFCSLRGLMTDCRDAWLFPLYECPAQITPASLPPFEASLMDVLGLLKNVNRSRQDLLLRRSFVEQLLRFASQLLTASWWTDLLASSSCSRVSHRRGSVSSLDYSTALDSAERSALPLDMLLADDGRCVAAAALTSRFPFVQLPSHPRTLLQIQALVARQPLPRGSFSLPNADGMAALSRLSAERSSAGRRRDSEQESPERELSGALEASLEIAEKCLSSVLSTEAEQGEAEAALAVFRSSLEFASVATAAWCFFSLKQRRCRAPSSETKGTEIEAAGETAERKTRVPIEWIYTLGGILQKLFDFAFRCSAGSAPLSVQLLLVEVSNAAVAHAEAAALAFYNGRLSAEGAPVEAVNKRWLTPSQQDSHVNSNEQSQSGSRLEVPSLSTSSPPSASVTSTSHLGVNSTASRRSVTACEKPAVSSGGGDGDSFLDPCQAVKCDLNKVLSVAIARLERKGCATASSSLTTLHAQRVASTQTLSPLAFFGSLVDGLGAEAEKESFSFAAIKNGLAPPRESRDVGGNKRAAISTKDASANNRDGLPGTADGNDSENCLSGARRITLLCQAFSVLVEVGCLLPANAFAVARLDVSSSKEEDEARLQLLERQLWDVAFPESREKPLQRLDCTRRISAAELLLKEGFFQRMLLKEPLLSFILPRVSHPSPQKQSQGLSAAQIDGLHSFGGFGATANSSFSLTEGSSVDGSGWWRPVYESACSCSTRENLNAGAATSLKRAPSHVALCRVLHLFERTLQWLRKHRYPLLMKMMPDRQATHRELTQSTETARHRMASLKRLVHAVLGVMKLLQRRARHVMETALQEGRLALLEEAAVYVRLVGALPPWAFLSAEEKAVVRVWINAARKLGRMSVRSLDAALFASTPTLRAFSFFELCSGASCSERESAEGLFTQPRRTAGGAAGFSNWVRQNAGVRESAEPGSRAAIPSILHQRGLVLLLECIRGFAVALDRSTLVLPSSHQLPPPQSLRIPLAPVDTEAANGEDASRTSIHTQDSPAARAVSAEVYVQLLHSAEAANRSASTSAEALGGGSLRKESPERPRTGEQSKVSPWIGTAPRLPNSFSCCVPPLSMSTGMLGQNFLAGRAKPARGVLGVGSEGMSGLATFRSEEEESAASSLTVQWFGTTLQQLTAAMKVLQRALDLGQRLEEEKLLTASGQRLLPLSISLGLEEKVVLPSAPSAESTSSLPKASPGVTKVTAPCCSCKKLSSRSTPGGTSCGGGLSGHLGELAEQFSASAEFGGSCGEGAMKGVVVDEEWDAACAPLVSIRGFREILSVTLQQTAAVGAGIVSSLVAGNVLRFQEEAVKQFVGCLARLSSGSGGSHQSFAPSSVFSAGKRFGGADFLHGNAPASSGQHSQPSLGVPSTLSASGVNVTPSSKPGGGGGGLPSVCPALSQDSADFFSALLTFVRRRLEVEERVVQSFGSCTPLVLQPPTAAPPPPTRQEEAIPLRKDFRS